jgi:acyl carrier protein
MSVPTSTADAVVRERLAAELLLDPGQVTPETALAALPGLDSIKLLSVVAELERAFAVTIDDDSLYDLQTVADLTALVGEPTTPA